MMISKTGFPEHEYTMPAEFAPHSGTIIIWPERPGSWNYGAAAARRAFTDVIAAAAAGEMVYVAVSGQSRSSAEELLLGGDAVPGSRSGTWRRNPLAESGKSWQRHVELFLLETDDAWARDIGPTFLVRRQPVIGETNLLGVSWAFNAWGGTFDGLYAHWEKDDAFAARFCQLYGYPVCSAAPFVLEGGSISSDGEGTILTTEACLMSAGRNPSMSKAQIERMLLTRLGAEKILWLPRGISGDETNEHVDNVCTFLRPGEVVLAWTDNKDDPQYALCRQDLAVLEHGTDAAGRNLQVHKLPIPDVPICIRAHDLAGFSFEAGEDRREIGERLAASYVNFYFANDAVLLPVFGGENTESDARAVSLLQEWLPERNIVPIAARDILTGGGNIHCITQQIPREPEVRNG